MTDKTQGTSRVRGMNSDTVRRNCLSASNRMTSKFRDVVTEILNRATCKHGLQVRTRCGVKPEPAPSDATIRKFRTVARKGACRLKSLVALSKTHATGKTKREKHEPT